MYMQDNTVPKEPEELQNNNEVIESPNVTSSTEDQVTSIPPETIQPSNLEEPASSDSTIEQEDNSATVPTAQPAAPSEQVINTTPIQESAPPAITNTPVMAPSVGVAPEPTKKKSSKKTNVKCSRR